MRVSFSPSVFAVSRRARRRAFTLIELLTVIAIIGILAAILIPVVSKVREHAKRSQNIANLRTIGLACHAYANDNRGIMPQVQRRATGPQQTHGPVLYVSQRSNPLSLLSSKWGEPGTAWGAADYLPGPDAFYGPLTPNVEREPAKFMPYTSAGAYVISYVYYSLPTEDFSSPPRNPVAPNLFNDRNDRGSYLPKAPLFSDPTSEDWGNLAGGFTGSKISCVHLDGSVSTYDRTFVFGLASGDKIRAMAGLLSN